MKRALLIEGLGSYCIGFVRRVYKKPLQDMGFIVDSSPQNRQPTRAYELIIGHSFGGGYAIKNKYECGVLITFDARVWSFWENDKLVRPNNADFHLNIYQTNGLRGYPVKNANLNYEIHKTSHVGIVDFAKPVVWEILKKGGNL